MLKLALTKEVEGEFATGVFGDLIENFYRVLGERIDEMLEQGDGLVDLILVNDKTIAGINEEYRGIKGATDVISFAYLEAGRGGVEGVMIAGDIFISIDTARRQAEEKGHALERELAILFVHGLLHCFGFDHNTDEEEAEMEGWPEKVLG